MQIAAIMPCRGRPEQTVVNVQRLLATASDVRLWCVTGGEPELATGLHEVGFQVMAYHRVLTYWEALKWATDSTPDATHLIGLANDLWACDEWLKFAVEDYRAAFGDGPGLLGFAGDGHGPGHSCHFLISRGLLGRYGGWPVWYQHNFGDRELCARAQADRCYAKSGRAWLEHCHPERGLAEDDAVYLAGRATYRQDETIFVERRRAGWPHVSP